MSEQPDLTKSELLANMNASWTALNMTLDRLKPEQWLTPLDEQGWSVTDHVGHLADWENSVVYLLQGKPRHEGLGIDEALYGTGDEDEENAALQARWKDRTPQETRARLYEVHGQTMDLLAQLTETDLYQPYRHFLPDEPGEGDGPPVINVIHGNTGQHYSEHLAWIRSLVAR